LSMLSGFNGIGNDRAADLMSRAYNDWVIDWCSAGPERLFPAAVLPLVSATDSANEMRRVAANGFKLAMVRPIPLRGLYPLQREYDALWHSFCETRLVVGMHTLGGPGTPWGDLLDRAADKAQMPGPAPTRCLGFVHEAMTFVASMLLSGFFERFPNMPPMAIMESNATWLPIVLEQCDRVAKSKSGPRLAALPSETFMSRCFIAFEGDEEGVHKQHTYFENIGIWSSDLPHIDGSDAWTAMREMDEAGVPEKVQGKLLGANACRMYGIPAKTFTTTEPESYGPRPAWFPSDADLDREFASRVAPR
ncbi:MAG: amidohydrolase family protein, partial [Chloroflexi bacterium]|nr:amidohydrolase family protein [Chloroflexota bacterium]